MTLTETLAEAVANSASSIPEEIRESMLEANQKIIETGIEKTAIKTGATVPDFTLENASGDAISLSETLRQGPVVLLFYRGGWCPYCNLELRAYQEALDTIKALGASLIAISPESPDNSLSTAEKNELSFDVLSDTDFEASNKFGLTFTFPEVLVNVYKNFGLDVPGVNDDDEWRLPIPAAYVIDRDGMVVKHHVDVNYTERLDPLDAIAALEKLK